MAYLYAIEFPDGKKYIGATSKSVRARFSLHLRTASKYPNRPVCAAILKFKTDFSAVRVLAEVDSIEYLREIEERAIRIYGTVVPDGYNLTRSAGKESFGARTPEKSRIRSKNHWRTKLMEDEDIAMNELIRKLESHVNLGSTYTARLLGYAYPTYAQYRSGLRRLPLYAERHIQAVMLLPRPALDLLIREHVFDGNR